MNISHGLFLGVPVMRAVIEEATTLASLTLFLGTMAAWVQIIATVWQMPEIWG
jgi:hypothetical protein